MKNLKKQIQIVGSASQKNLWKGDLSPEDLEKTALEWLQSLGIPIATSCFGKGFCQKCLINKKLLACTTTLEVIILNENAKISIDYL